MNRSVSIRLKAAAAALFALPLAALLTSQESFAYDPEIKDPKIRQLYYYYKAQCHDSSLPPEQQSQACDLSIRYGTLESEIAATNKSNEVKTQYNQLLLNSLRGR
jgi:hypothetical protein